MNESLALIKEGYPHGSARQGMEDDMKPVHMAANLMAALALVGGIHESKIFYSSRKAAAPEPSSVTRKAAPHPLHAIHLTAWMAGSAKGRRRVEDILAHTGINALTIDVKEYGGDVYLPGVPAAEKAGAYKRVMPGISQWLADLKKKNIYTIARIVVFRDNVLPRKNPHLAVRSKAGVSWRDRQGVTWLNPHNRDAWRYNLVIALKAVRLGFDEVQFDYVRFPTDGSVSQIQYAAPHSQETASAALLGFLRQASQLLHPLGAKVSVDVFGLSTTVTNGMGIGQLLGPMAREVDYVCPMIYPSHYSSGNYGLPDPNKQPYETVRYALTDALKMLGPEAASKLRPYFQDFSLGVRYGEKEVLAQLRAARELGVQNWTLWNPRCVYTVAALRRIPAISEQKKSTIAKGGAHHG